MINLYNNPSGATGPVGNWNVQTKELHGMANLTVPDKPQEPCTLNRADELLKYTGDLNLEMSRTQAILFGCGSGTETSEKSISPSSLDGKIAEACSRAASLCGFLRTINNQLAG